MVQQRIKDLGKRVLRAAENRLGFDRWRQRPPGSGVEDFYNKCVAMTFRMGRYEMYRFNRTREDQYYSNVCRAYQQYSQAIINEVDKYRVPFERIKRQIIFLADNLATALERMEKIESGLAEAFSVETKPIIFPVQRFTESTRLDEIVNELLISDRDLGKASRDKAYTYNRAHIDEEFFSALASDLKRGEISNPEELRVALDKIFSSFEKIFVAIGKIKEMEWKEIKEKTRESERQYEESRRNFTEYLIGLFPLAKTARVFDFPKDPDGALKKMREARLRRCGFDIADVDHVDHSEDGVDNVDSGDDNIIDFPKR